MPWQKKGLIYAPNGEFWWAQGYAHVPTVTVIEDKIIRVFFAALDENKYGRIGYVDLDASNPHKVLYETEEPVLDIGELGCFDDCGVVPSCVINYNNATYLYYIGFQRAERVPYMLFSGLAIADNGTTNFKKYSHAPILDRTNADPFSRSAPFILVEGSTLKMWYWSCVRWTNDNNTINYNNVIKYTSSEDGINWKSTNFNCIEPDFKEEFSVGRPWVIYENGLYKMWYSIRGFSVPYSLGYAESADGLHWIRKDSEVGLEKSQSGWDSEMVCYPCIIDAQGHRYMFYNGNRHGATGFGYAIWVE